jgi:hypothetical protein
MKKRNRILLAALVVVVIGGLMWMALREPPEPVYQGKPLSVWLRSYEAAGVLQTSQETDNAVRSMGTNSIPFLLQRMRANDSSLQRRLVHLAVKQRLVKFRYTPASALRCEAVVAFGRLGTSASNAVPELIKICKWNTSTEVQCDTMEALGNIGPAAGNAVPILLMRTSSTNALVSASAIWQLGRIHAQPETVVPALIKILLDSNSKSRFCAACALADFGSDARSAVPLLIEYFNNEPDNSQKPYLAEGIKRIDPEAAAKAGVK